MFKFDVKLEYDDMVRDLRKKMRRTNEEARQIIKKYTSNTKRDAKLNAQKDVDTGYLMRNIRSNIELGGMTGTVQSFAEYSPHVEYGHMVYKGQMFPLFDKTTFIGMRRIKATRFIEGSHYMGKAYDKNEPGFIREMTEDTMKGWR